MTRSELVAAGIHVARKLCLADETTTLSQVAHVLKQQGVVKPLACEITTTWLLDVYLQGPFERVGYDGFFKLRKKQ